MAHDPATLSSPFNSLFLSPHFISLCPDSQSPFPFVASGSSSTPNSPSLTMASHHPHLLLFSSSSSMALRVLPQPFDCSVLLQFPLMAAVTISSPSSCLLRQRGRTAKARYKSSEWHDSGYEF